MQDLIDKIEQLRKSLAAMKPKDQTLVPALALPPVKPLSISAASGGSAKPAKLPGVAPISNKDPKKMAEQLKNPRPKKPKVEMLKFDKNGQWDLEKANWGKRHTKEAGHWAESGLRHHLDRLPKASDELRGDMLSDLTSQAQSRINPETNHKEFLLHRAMPAGGHKTDFHGKNRSSWTANPGFASYWADTQGQSFPGEKTTQQQVVSAWIPHHKIHSYLPTVLGPNHEKYGEQEVIVEPHNVVPHKIKTMPIQKMKKFGEGNSV